MSKLLIHEPPLQILPSLAEHIGLNEAIVLQQTHYWLNNPKTGVIRDGHKWIFNTYDEWRTDNFPFWSTATIQRTFSNLEQAGLIVAKQLDKRKRDMRKFYRIDYEKLAELEDNKLTTPIIAKCYNENIAKCDDVNRNTETTTETTLSERKKAAQERKAKQRASKKGDAVDLLLKGLPVFQARDNMRRRIEVALGDMRLAREWDIPRSEWSGYELELIQREEDAGQTIEQFMTWFGSDDFRKGQVMYLTPAKIEKYWNQAFTPKSKDQEYETL